MMTYENLARVLNAEKYEALSDYKCAKGFCTRLYRRRNE